MRTHDHLLRLLFVATSQAKRTVQALRQSVEVAERRAVEVEKRANTQVQEVKHIFNLKHVCVCVCVYTKFTITIATVVVAMVC